jgi:hypothetical protein
LWQFFRVTTTICLRQVDRSLKSKHALLWTRLVLRPEINKYTS